METKFNLIFFWFAILLHLDKINADFRIVGGVSLGDKEYLPYQISIQVLKNNGQIEHFCGGSILTPKTILTAAHCVAGKDISRLNVVGGINDLNDTVNEKRSQVVGTTIHADYKEFSSNDIALVYIDPPLNLDGIRVDKIDYTYTKEIEGGEKLMLSGWGAISVDGAQYPMRMQKLSYKTISNEQCKQSMETITDAELCAVMRAKGSCGGDSGGPLVLKEGNTFRQIGIVSYGTLLCATDYPDVYTRVGAFVDWIQERLL